MPTRKNKTAGEAKAGLQLERKVFPILSPETLQTEFSEHQATGNAALQDGRHALARAHFAVCAELSDLLCRHYQTQPDSQVEVEAWAARAARYQRRAFPKINSIGTKIGAVMP